MTIDVARNERGRLAGAAANGGLLALLIVVSLFIWPRALFPEGAEPSNFYFEMARMPEGYFVAKDLVTQAAYQDITGENPSEFLGGHRPVENVSWEDAVAFCEALTKREQAAGHLPAGWRYDLPADAQFDEMLADATIKNAVTSLMAARDGTADVGTLPANSLGLRDVLGNVWEWCRDWYTEEIRRKDANPDLPLGGGVPVVLPGSQTAATDLERFKVLRGGAWDTTPADGFKPASRLRYAPGMANAHTGFRCVLVPSP